MRGFQIQTQEIINLPNQVSEFVSELMSKIGNENADFSAQSFKDPLTSKVIKLLSSWKNNISQMSILAPNESTSDAHIARPVMLEKLARIFNLETKDESICPIESEIQSKVKSYGLEFELKSQCIFNSLLEAAKEMRKNSETTHSFEDLYA